MGRGHVADRVETPRRGYGRPGADLGTGWAAPADIL